MDANGGPCMDCGHRRCYCACHIIGKNDGLLPSGFLYKPSDEHLVADLLDPVRQGVGLPLLLNRCVHRVDFFQSTPGDLANRRCIAPNNWIFISPRQRTSVTSTNADRRVLVANHKEGYWKGVEKTSSVIDQTGTRVADKTVLQYINRYGFRTTYRAQEYVPTNSQRVQIADDEDRVMEDHVLFLQD